MFQLQPSTEGALGIDNHSLVTNATRVSNATTEISKAAANTPFPKINITDDDDNTYISGGTTATALSSPPTSTESSSSSILKPSVLRTMVDNNLLCNIEKEPWTHSITRTR